MGLSLVNKLFGFEGKIYRILVEKDKKFLVIDCIKRIMPYWVDSGCLNIWKELSEDDLKQATKFELPNISDLNNDELKEMHIRFGTISYALVKIEDDDERKLSIHKAACDYKVSEQTIRHRLCDYLAFNNIAVLAPKVKKNRELSDDEKNFRWALNKFFYNSKKLSLRQAYKYLIREKYMDSDGKILQNCPKFHQFKYFYYKNRNESNFIISRWGRGEYDKKYRPLLGDGVRDYFPSIGYGMLDSTTCDIYLINDSGQLVGRPILSACIDAYSGMCLGYSLGWQGGITSLRKLMNNVIEDKVEYCKKFGIEIEKDKWNCHWIPHKLITDMGSEYIGETFSQLVELGIEFKNLEPYRPELKSLVERFFGLVQEYFKKELIDKGVVLKDFGDRGAFDYRKNACLTLSQFEKILLLCIIHYNCGRVIELPYKNKDIDSHSNCLWNSCLMKQKNMLIEVNKETLELVLMPRCAGRFKRDGLWVNKYRYKAFGFTNDFIKGGEALVAYDPKNVGHVWLIRNKKYYEFILVEKFFDGMSLEEANSYKVKRSEDEFKRELESEIELSKSIEDISKVDVVNKKINVRGIRKNRYKEILK